MFREVKDRIESNDYSKPSDEEALGELYGYPFRYSGYAMIGTVGLSYYYTETNKYGDVTVGILKYDLRGLFSLKSWENEILKDFARRDDVVNVEFVVLG